MPHFTDLRHGADCDISHLIQGEISRFSGGPTPTLPRWLPAELARGLRRRSALLDIQFRSQAFGEGVHPSEAKGVPAEGRVGLRLSLQAGVVPGEAISPFRHGQGRHGAKSEIALLRLARSASRSSWRQGATPRNDNASAAHGWTENFSMCATPFPRDGWRTHTKMAGAEHPFREAGRGSPAGRGARTMLKTRNCLVVALGCRSWQ